MIPLHSTAFDKRERIMNTTVQQKKKCKDTKTVVAVVAVVVAFDEGECSLSRWLVVLRLIETDFHETFWGVDRLFPPKDF